MSNYTVTTDFLAKDALIAGDPNKLVLGAELDVEFDAIAAALATKTDGNGSVVVGDKGDITVSNAGLTWTIDNLAVTTAKINDLAVTTGKINTAAVTLAKMADLTSQQFIARKTASTGVPEAWTISDLTADTAPDPSADYVITWDASASLMKKVLVEAMPNGIPQNAQTGNYGIVAADNGKQIYHASGAGASDTYTLPANGTIALPIGFAVSFVNLDSNAVSIAITSDTMYLAGTGTTGTRSLAQYGIATAVKVDTTLWVISGSGLT